jgi:hypothetical protein
VQTIAGGCLHGLSLEGNLVPQDQIAKFMVTNRFAMKYFGIDSIRVASDLHKVLVGDTCRSEQEKTACHAFLADRAYLDAVTVFHDGDDRNHSDFDEVRVWNGLVRLVDSLLNLKLDAF